MNHQNILAVLYFGTGYFTSFCCMLTSSELHVQAFGGLLLIKFTWLISEQL